MVDIKLYQKKYREEHKDKIQRYQKKYREKHKDEAQEYNKKWYAENKEGAKVGQKEWRDKNKESISKRNKKYVKENSTEVQEYQRKWRKENRKKRYEYMKVYYKENRDRINMLRRKKYVEDTNRKIKSLLSSRILLALKGNIKHKSTFSLVGCSVFFLKRHLESQFQRGMSWANHGKWHIDHIVPCDSFDLKQPYEQKICFNWFNLQPLWAKDNHKKNRRYINITKL